MRSVAGALLRQLNIEKNAELIPLRRVEGERLEMTPPIEQAAITDWWSLVGP